MTSTATLAELRAWIIGGTEHEIRLAVQGAAQYSIGTLAELVEELHFDYDEACDKFLRDWLETLSPLERLAAAVRTEHFYQLGLCAIPQAADRALLQVMESVKPAIEELAGSFEWTHRRASDPDPSFTKRYTQRLVAYAEQLRSVAEDIGNDVPLVRHISDEVARLEKADPEGCGQPAKYRVADALELDPELPHKKLVD
ncbi:hypothetical protein [Glutamicibacter arilaitensis]|uniref:hypothetical protein n=1 Tax=Glutamicibacter arilaitensis TaxID=256701 RepID=UPI00384B449E